eukprot:SAG31_NODE_5451_length_2531_cov_2.005345_3_plen_97_part_00
MYDLYVNLIIIRTARGNMHRSGARRRCIRSCILSCLYYPDSGPWRLGPISLIYNKINSTKFILDQITSTDCFGLRGARPSATWSLKVHVETKFSYF